MYYKIATLLTICIYFNADSTCSSAEQEHLKRIKRFIQNDEASEERSNQIDQENQVLLELTPKRPTVVTEGDDLTFNCKIRNRPPESQLQWYYIMRREDGGFENFTIIANEVATVDNEKYYVSTTPPNIHTFKVKYFDINDTGEYCCFLYVSFEEAYRKSTQVVVGAKPTPQPDTPLRHSRTSADHESYEKSEEIDQAVEEMIEELNIQEELTKRFNATYMRGDARTRRIIENATKQIKSLLQSSASEELTDRRESTQRAAHRENIKSQVKTVVRSLFSSVSDVNATLAHATASILSKIMASKRRNRPPTTDKLTENPSQTSDTDDWRKIYDDYLKQRSSNSSSEETESGQGRRESRPESTHTPTRAAPTTARETARAGTQPPTRPRDNQAPQTNSVPSPVTDDDEWERREEESNTLVHETPTRISNKCEYQLVINEFNPNQCPSMRTPTSAAAWYQEAQEDSRKAETPRIINEQISRLENKLIDEIVNAKMVNNTVKMHDTMLANTEEKLKEQTISLEKVENLLSKVSDELTRQQLVKKNMDNKLAGVMLNIIEVNKRLDTAMSQKPDKSYDKQVAVIGSAENNACDRHENVTHHKDCSEVAEAGNIESGIYYIRPIYAACPIPVWCDLDTYPGGWAVIQRREVGSVNFGRNWNEYRRGFGNVTGEHWLGNDNIFLLSNQDEYMLRVDLWDFYDSRVFAEYRVFKIEGERDGFRLIADDYSGTAGDGLKTHNNQKFSTYDKDHDQWDDYHCAYEWGGGWWFTNCWSSYLNGPYYNESNPPYNGISWREWKEEQLYRSEMKIRPVYHLSKPEPVTIIDEFEEADETEESSDESSETPQSDQPIASRRAQHSQITQRRPTQYGHG